MLDDWVAYGNIVHRWSCRSPQRWLRRALPCAFGCTPVQIAEGLKTYGGKTNWPCKPCRRCASDVRELMNADA